MFFQFFINGLLAAGVYLLVALGFSLVYSVNRFFHFAHAIILTSAAYYTYLFYVWLNSSLLLAFLLSLILSVLLGCLIEIVIYRPLRNKGASSLILLLASLGTYIVLQNVISLCFGDDAKSIRSGVVNKGMYILGARITPVQVCIMFVSAISVIIVTLLLKKTKMGRAMRAVSNDPELADICGIDSERVFLWVIAVGSVLAAIAGILISLDINMTPTMGMSALLMGVVAAVIGGINSIIGVALGAILLGMAQHFGVWKISSQWQEPIAFTILLLFLFLRPQGFSSRKIRKESV